MQQKSEKTRIILLSIPILLGILVGYIFQFCPTPLMSRIAQTFSLLRPDGTLDLINLNISESIIFPFIIISSIFGVIIDQKIKTRRMYTLTLALLATGMVLSGLAPSFIIFLIGRAIYGIGYGLSVVFIGSAVVQWYNNKHGEFMFTINGLFPFIGTALAFSLLVPLSIILGDSWSNALLALGLLCALMLIYWIFVSKKIVKRVNKEEDHEKLKDIYKFLFKNRTIKLLSVAFFSDFFFFAFISSILVVFFQTKGNMSDAFAGLWAAIAFPGISFFGGIFTGIVMMKTGRKKPSMFSAQFLKLFGVLVMFAGAMTSIIPVMIGGIFFYGIGDGMLPPAMYSLIAEQKNMTPSRVGAGFSLVLSCGFIAGVISPIFGAWINNIIIDGSGISDPIAAQAHGLTWGLFLIGIVSCIICIIFVGLIKEDTAKIKY